MEKFRRKPMENGIKFKRRYDRLKGKDLKGKSEEVFIFRKDSVQPINGVGIVLMYYILIDLIVHKQ